MPAGDLYKLILRGQMTNSNQRTLNIFHYLQTSGTSGANGLSIAWYNKCMLSLTNICHVTQNFVLINVMDMADPTDFYNQVIDNFGSVAGEGMPSQDAMSFTYVSNRNDARSGGKRFGRYPESFQTSGIKQNGASAAIAALEADLESNIISGSDTWRPVIYGHRLPLGNPTLYSNPISAVVFYGFSTQNNRKENTGPGW